MTELKRLAAERKIGTEPFHVNGQRLDFDLLGFWQWCVSDLVSNATRGRLAEYIVACALGLPEQGIRDEWASFDLKTLSGIKIEVKSSAYIQSWDQKKLSPITFRTPKTRAWDADTGLMDIEAKRQADVYVFALLAHTDQETIDPLNLDQWRFYVVPTAILDARVRSQHSITLNSLEKLVDTIPFSDLAQVVEKCKEKEIV